MDDFCKAIEIYFKQYYIGLNILFNVIYYRGKNNRNLIMVPINLLRKQINL